MALIWGILRLIPGVEKTHISGLLSRNSKITMIFPNRIRTWNSIQKMKIKALAIKPGLILGSKNLPIWKRLYTGTTRNRQISSVLTQFKLYSLPLLRGVQQIVLGFGQILSQRVRCGPLRRLSLAKGGGRRFGQNFAQHALPFSDATSKFRDFQIHSRHV